jgi:predicted Zn-dependent protease
MKGLFTPIVIRALYLSSILLIPAWAAAQDEKGVYEPLELRKREPNDLIDTSAQYHDMFARRSLLFEDPGVLALVRRIGEDLAPPPTDDYIHYEFFVLRDPSPNAFALPNGQIYVHTGMLARLSDESELAGLLGHEITHVAGHHTILSHRITAKRLAIQIFVGGLASLMGQLRYSRQLEQEADDRALLMLKDSAYDPYAMPDLLDMLSQDFEGLDPRLPTIWTTHPDPEGRAATSRALVEGMPHRERDPGVFDAVTYSLRAITIRDYIQDDYPYTAIALADDLLERYPDDLDFRMLLGDAWRVLGPRSEFAPEDFTNKDRRRNLRQRVWRTREERRELLLETAEGQQASAANMQEAQRIYEDILQRDPDYAAAHRGLGQVYEALGNEREAARSYLAYVRAAPDAPDRSVYMSKLVELRDSIQRQESSDESH